MTAERDDFKARYDGTIEAYKVSTAAYREKAAKLTASEAAREKLHEALRSHVICHWVGPDKPAVTEGECLQCDSRWPMPGEEKHKPDCLAAPAKEPDA